MGKKYLIVILAATVLILAGVVALVFFQKQRAILPIVPSEEVIRPGAEEDFYSYLELPSHNGKFLKFDKTKSEITILYFDTETMKIISQTFKIDKKTIFSKVPSESSKPDLFPKKDLQKVEEETRTTVFYLLPEKENEIPLARLIQVEASF